MFLELSRSEANQLKSSWAAVCGTSSSDRFINAVYSNLLSEHTKLRSEFVNADQIHLHAMIFEDLIQFVVSNTNDPALIHEFMNEFLEENDEFVSVAANYLEPMGSILMKTFETSLPNFSSELHTSWIKVYVYIANAVLSYNDETDAESVATETSEVQPLFTNQDIPARAHPVTPVSTQAFTPVKVPSATPKEEFVDAQAPSPVIQFSLASNEKYRGFRRNANSAPTPTHEPISVKIPSRAPSLRQGNISSSLSSMISTASLSTVYATPPSTPFDPRRSKRCGRSPVSSSDCSINEEFEIPMKSPRRTSFVDPPVEDDDEDEEPVSPVSTISPAGTPVTGSLRSAPSLLRKLQMARPVSDSESEEESIMAITQEKFDPRKKKHVRMNSLSSFISSPESSEVDEQEDAKLLFKELPPVPKIAKPLPVAPKNAPSAPEAPASTSQSAKTTVPTPRFDYASFGMRGLAPISESAERDDDVASSKYESGDDVTDNASSHYGDDEGSNKTDDICSTSASTLSLHNSDYRSSISSATSPTEYKTQPTEQKSPAQSELRYPSSGSEISSIATAARKQMSSPMVNASAKMYSQSTPSSTTSLLLSKNGSGGARVSMGFMRSSFVLKKEMQESGLSENAFLKPRTIADFNSPARSLTSLGSLSERKINSNGSSCFDLINAFESEENDTLSSYDLMRHSSVRQSHSSNLRHARSAGNLNPTQKLSSNHANAVLEMKAMKKDVNGYILEKPGRRSFMSKISSMFSSKKSSGSVSSAGSIYSGRASTMSSKFDPKGSRYGDNFTIHSCDSEASLSGFSFMTSSVTRSNLPASNLDARMNLAPRKANKYNISKTPNKLFFPN